MKVLQVIYTVYALLLFAAIMLVIFPFVLLASLLGRIRGGNIILRLCSFWSDCWFPLIFIFHKKIYEAPHSRQQQYIFISNHISYLDSAVLVKAFRQRVRVLAKVEMSKIPVFGYIYSRVIVAVDRSSQENRARSILILKSIISRGISVVVFPEGTFNTTPAPVKEFYDGAFRLAIETQTPLKPVLFLDTFSRMHYNSLFTLNPGISRIVYLAEIPVAGLSIADIELLKQKAHAIMSEKLKQYQASWIGHESQRNDINLGIFSPEIYS